MYPVFKPAYKGHKFLQYAYPGSSPALDGNRGPQHGFLPFPLLHMVVGALEASASLCYSSALSLSSPAFSLLNILSLFLSREDLVSLLQVTTHQGTMTVILMQHYHSGAMALQFHHSTLSNTRI